MNQKIFIVFAAVCMFNISLFAQKKKGEPEVKPDAAHFKWEQSKLIPKLKKLAITELTVNYKLQTTAKTLSSGNMIAGAKVAAYLETTDGELTTEDFQGITDHFYSYFQKKLKENGIDTVGWNEVTATDFYQKIGDDDDKTEDDSKKKAGGQQWVSSTAHKGKIVHSGQAGFAGGKGKRSIGFAKDLDCTAAAFKVNVDFADVMVNLSVNKKTTEDYFYVHQTTTTKTTWGVNPVFQVGDQYRDRDHHQWTYAWGSKGWPEFLYQWSDITVPGQYAETVTEDVSKRRSTAESLFAFSKELTPVLIQTTREKYKTAATHAVEKWADAFVERAVQMRKN